MRHTRSNPVRRGITLIELLVVISIMMLLAAVAVPMMRPTMEGRRVREAARAINVYLSSARSEAMRTGRPVGVMLRRLDGQPECSMVLEQAEVPPTYAGDTTDAKVRVQTVNRATGAVRIFVQDGVFTDGLVRHVRQNPVQPARPVVLDSAGPTRHQSSDPDDFEHYYFDFADCTDSDSDGYNDDDTDLTATSTHGSARAYGVNPPWPDAPLGPPISTEASHPVSFEIQRSRSSRTRNPCSCPPGRWSILTHLGPTRCDSGPPTGIRPTRPPVQDFTSVCIMFSPTGAVDRFYTYTESGRRARWCRDGIAHRLQSRPHLPAGRPAGAGHRVAAAGHAYGRREAQLGGYGQPLGYVESADGSGQRGRESQVNAAEDPTNDVNCDPNDDLSTPRLSVGATRALGAPRFGAPVSTPGRPRAWEDDDVKRRAGRRGVSLMEVLIGTFVLSVGLLGLAALIPVGRFAIVETAKSDRAGACGRAALRDMQVCQMIYPGTLATYGRPHRHGKREPESQSGGQCGHRFLPSARPVLRHRPAADRQRLRRQQLRRTWARPTIFHTRPHRARAGDHAASNARRPVGRRGRAQPAAGRAGVPLAR